MAYASIIFTVVTLVLVTTGVIKSKWYIITIYLAGLLTIYSTTLMGLSVIGSDISKEAQMSALAMKYGWNLNMHESSSSSFVVGWLVPELSKFLHITIASIYKVLLPLSLALVPTILYIIFRKQFGPHRAFYASLFFIMVPVFSLEMAIIGKSMIAEALMALCFWIIFTSWRIWIKAIGILLVALAALFAHYTIGVILISYMLGILLIMILAKLARRWWHLWRRRTMPLWILAVVSSICIPMFLIYYSTVAQGVIISSIASNNITQTIVQKTTSITTAVSAIMISRPTINTPAQSSSNSQGTTSQPPQSSQAKKQTAEETKEPKEPSNFSITKVQDPLVHMGIGLDFLQASVLGKLFRIMQYLTQALIVIGSIWLFVKYKLYEVRAEFAAGVGASFVMLAMCIFVPNFSRAINMTRFYHMSLFFLAPCFVLGFDAVDSLISKIRRKEN